VTLKRTISYIFILLIFFVLAIFIVLASFSLLLPRALQSSLISEITNATGISDLSLHVREFDLDGADFGEVRFGDEAAPALIVRSIQVDYTPAGLVQKKLKQVAASGIELHIEFKDGKFGFRGVNLESLLQRVQSRLGGAADSSKTESLLTLERLVLRNVNVHIQDDSGTYLISGHVEILPERVTFDRIACTAQIYTRGHEITLTADFDLNNKSNTLNFSAQDVMLARFADFTGKIDGLHLSGRANIDASATLAWDPLQITRLSSIIDFKEIDLDVGEIKFQNPVNQKIEKLPWSINLETINGNEFVLSATELVVVRPLPLNLSQMNFRLKRTEDSLHGGGNFLVLPTAFDERQSDLFPVTIIKSLPLAVNATLQSSKVGELAFTLNAQSTKKESSKSARFRYRQYNIKTAPPKIDITGNVDKIRADASYKINIPGVEIASDNGNSYKFQAVRVDGAAALERQSNADSRLTFNLRLPGSKVSTASAEFNIPAFSLKGRMAHNNKKQIITALLKLDDASMIFPEKDVSINAVHGQIPIQWPPGDKQQAGTFSTGSLQFQNVDLGSVIGTIQQTRQGFDFSGHHNSKIIPELKVGFRGATKLFQTKTPDTRIEFQREPPVGNILIHMEKLLPRAKGVTINGKFSIHGNLIFSKPGLSGSLETRIENGKLLLPENKVSIEGIQVAVSLPELPDFRSAPQQQLLFKKATAGGIVVHNGRIEFQVESLNSLFIEKSQFKWSDGKVETYATRIIPGLDDYRLILYCDRLNMVKVLEQFAAAKATGEVTVNGRIPLQYKNGNISFDDGILYSIPGEEGKIRVQDTEILTAGIPPGTPQHLQMELASEALKDYDVEWSKLSITSEGEDVLLRMQLKGNPAQELPFTYDIKQGGFTRIEDGGKGSMFEKIHLNVNFRLPLNQMLQYKEIFEMIQ
jgi:hypothetical protein